MSEQLQRGDRKIEKVSENRFHIHVYDGTTWQYRHVADREGATNYVDENLKLLGTDRAGNPIFRPKK